MKEGESVLSDVKITAPKASLKASAYRGYVRQQPNAKWFNLVRVPLGIYCLSSADSVRSQRRMSRLLRRIGEAPVIYSPSLTEYSRQNLVQALESEGYLHARVDTVIGHRGHKTTVCYRMTPGPRFYVRSLDYHFDNDTVRRFVQADSAACRLRRGMPLDLNRLSDERSRIVKALHNQGYYYINKDYVTFDIDTIRGDLGVGLTVHVDMPAGVDTLRAYQQQHYRRVRIYGLGREDDLSDAKDSLLYRGLTYMFNGRPRLNKSLLAARTALHADSLYRERDVQNSYSSFGSLPAVSFATLSVNPAANGAPDSLDCDVRLFPAKTHSIGLDVEGTNTAGDLGAAASLTYTNKNLFRGAEQFSIKLRGAYEAIRGLKGYSNQNYTEWSVEASLRFPSLLVPGIGVDKKRSLKASSDARVMFDMQDRPEFHRRVLTAAWSYAWNRAPSSPWSHRYDLLSVNYIYMPWISDTFRQEYLEGDDPHYSVLRYSYENLFILKTGYSFTYNSLGKTAAASTGLYQTNGFQVKFAFELAGNLLYAISKATRSQRSDDGYYNLFGIAYSQYAKVDLDFSKSLVLNDRNSLAFHAALGFAQPYGNSTILPYEKRYFSGGANSVRGWSVRELGPGAYQDENGKIDFITQTGNLKLDLSVELRTYLFWKLHGAFFIDAGNVWNTRHYEGMDDGLFRWRSFYKQIAVAYGLGLRFNFNYFILRFDMGMKAINPAVPSGRLHYPISRPDFWRDVAAHFAIGLPF